MVSFICLRAKNPVTGVYSSRSRRFYYFLCVVRACMHVFVYTYAYMSALILKRCVGCIIHSNVSTLYVYCIWLGYLANAILLAAAPPQTFATTHSSLQPPRGLAPNHQRLLLPVLARSPPSPLQPLGGVRFTLILFLKNKGKLRF